MTLQTFVTVLSLAIGFVAGLYFCVGSAQLNKTTIGALAGTYWDSNPHLANFLRVLKAEYLCGGIALCLTFFLQFVASVPGVVPDRQAFDEPWAGAVLAIVCGGAIGALLLWLRGHLVTQLAAAAPRAE
ncbi:MAG: hypothetical protein AB7P08_04695 [Burkholderiales bacterium]